MTDLLLEEGVLDNIKNSSLFYPCSGHDLLTAINLFSPYVTDFMFVDRGYFTPGHQDTQWYGYDQPADQLNPVLWKDRRYKLIERHISEPRNYPISSPWDIVPCTLMEYYFHIETGRTIRICRRRGYGYSAFRKEVENLGVFFYRGDSQGEGGSGNHWLRKEHINEVCNKLIDNGLLVLDGSDGSPYIRRKGIYKELYSRSVGSHPYDYVMSKKSFFDTEGRHFRCVGYAGLRYGPTLIWQVTKKNEITT